MFLDVYGEDFGLPKRIVPGETRVVLLGGFYTSVGSNPAWGSDCACVGTFIRFDVDSRLPFRVLWDNGATNSYRNIELRIYGEPRSKLKENNPNRTFKKKKGEEGHETS